MFLPCDAILVTISFKSDTHFSIMIISSWNENIQVIKRWSGEHVTSRLVKMHNRESTFRVIAYNMHRMTVFIVWFLPSQRYDLNNVVWAIYYE